MNLDAVAARGRLPWRSAEGSRCLEVWAEYEVPLAGTFELSSGETVLFSAVGDISDLSGVENSFSLWAYVALTTDEVSETGSVSFDSHEDLERCIENLFSGKQAVLALADDLLLKHWSTVYVERSLLDSASDFLGGVLRAYEEKASPGERVRMRLAEASAVGDGLVCT